MKLPNADLAIVEEAKICDYLLSSSHPVGTAKAEFFGDFGFTAENWAVFAVALRQHGLENEVARSRETGFGPRYEVDGPLAAGRSGRALAAHPDCLAD